MIHKINNHRRRDFLKKSTMATAAIGLGSNSPGWAKAKDISGKSNREKKTNRPFIGVQLGKGMHEKDSLPQLFDEMQDRAAINTIIYFFSAKDARYGDNYHGGTQFRRDQADLDQNGRDLVDLMQEAASRRDMDIYMGGGEMFWANCLQNHAEASWIDCFGNPYNFACVNKPDWRKFQTALHNDLFEQHPYLKGFLFMHERSASFMPIFKPDTWRGDYNPSCFCEHCRAKGESRGIDAEKAAKGFRKMVSLFKDRKADLIRGGIMVGFWRILMEYPETLAWEKLQWDSFHDYRLAIVKAIKESKPNAVIGYHFQHHGLYGSLDYRAGDDPKLATEFADWVKPSLYAGASGQRYFDLLKKAQQSYLSDFDLETAHRVLSGWFNRSPENGWELLENESLAQSPFSPDWVRSEAKRIKESVSPLAMNAGLGIGVPGGEDVETPEYIAACTQACFDAGTDGIMLSRHYHEMRPELVKAAGEVIKKQYQI